MVKNISLIMMLMAGISLASAQQSTDQGEEITAELVKLLEKESKKDFSGTVLIMREGRELLSKSYGYANRADKIENSARTVYDIGSITKQFTAAAILKLEMQGQLQVSDDAALHIDELRRLDRPITVHQLLTHTAGLPGALGDDYEAVKEKDFIEKSIQYLNRNSSNGSYNYSNVGYSLLAIIIERLSGQHYEEFLSMHLFNPAGMKHTGYVLPRWDEDLIAHGYSGTKDWGRPNDKNWSASGPYLHLKGNGGLLSTSGDLYKWRVALQGDTVLSEEAKKKYFHQHVAEDSSMVSYYGYGWAIFPNTSKGVLIAHNGGNGYFFADFLNFPDTDQTIIVLCNAANRKVEDLAAKISRIL